MSMKEEELLEALKDMHYSWKCLNEIIEYRFPDVYKKYIKKLIVKTEQSYQQIKERIKAYAEHQEITASYIDIVLDLYEQLEKKKPEIRIRPRFSKRTEITEEFIGNKGRELFGWSADPRTIKECEDFIRSLFEEIQGKKK